ncbi:hypothetical protein PWT90_09330 [Aphanocladium album]|nr:hypothetical protein PWT90_09330 [Aphanocladium album]
MSTIDLNKVNDQLAKALNGNDGGAETAPAVRNSELTKAEEETEDESYPPTEVEDLVGNALVNEKKAHATLVEDGGRPLYPIQTIEAVSQDPEKHRGILLPFWRHPGINYKPDHQLDWEAFHRQLRQWKLFRTWQLDNRGIIEEPDFDAYFREHIQFLIRGYRGKGVAEIEAKPELLKGPGTQWEREQATRERDRQTYREQDCNTFEQYRQALMRRLASHGYTETVVLVENPRKQDPLAEWVEYLGFECWWLDDYIRESKRREDFYKRRWEYIRGQDLVSSDDTPEILDSWEAFDQRQAMRDNGRRELDAAKEEVKSARNQICGGDVGSTKKSDTSVTLDDALQRLKEAEEKYAVIDRRNRLISRLGADRRACKEARKNIDSQLLLVDSAARQIPLIKAEMAKSKKEATSTKHRKRRAQVEPEAATADASHKHRKSASPEADQKGTEKEVQQRDVPKRTGSKATQQLPPAGEPRRSARLAAQKATSDPTPTSKSPRRAGKKKISDKSKESEKPSTTQIEKAPRSHEKRSRQEPTRGRK